MDTSKQHSLDWDHWVRAEHVPEGGQWVVLEATEEERANLAERLDIKAIDFLEAKLHLIPKKSGYMLKIEGSLCADVRQECSISLEEVGSHIEDEFFAWYADYSKAASFTRAQHEMQAQVGMKEKQIMEESDDPEPMINGQVDLADLVCQYLSLAINPYVRSEKASETSGTYLEDSHNTGGGAAGTLKLNPFAALKDWRPKD